MANKYAVVRTDLMTGTDVRADLKSFKYMGAGTVETEVQNGHVVKLDGLMEGEREVFKAVTPAATDALSDIVLVASVEMMYDERKRNIDEFINEAGVIARGYIMHSRDIFSVTAEGIDGAADAQVGYAIELQAGTKLKAVQTATESSTVVGKLIAIEKEGRYTYYVIQVA